MEPVTARMWLDRHEDADFSSLSDFVDQLNLPDIIARLLISRQYSLDAAKQHLSNRLAGLPDPFLLPDMEHAVNRLVTALANGEKIAVHGDYDVDGITGTALLYSVLKAFGGNLDYHIPLRLGEGYGLSEAAIRSAAAEEVKVMVSVDCGISAASEARLANELGVDLIITDHHQPPDELPAACAVINPQREDSSFPFRELAGVGVAFFVLVALRKKLREKDWFIGREEPDLRLELDLVALGTIADLVPLKGVNRILTKHGLMLLQNGRRVGVRALKQVAGVKSVSSGVVGFQLAPRLNAAGRMEDASLGVQLLLEEDMVLAMNTARYLDQCNRSRQDIEKQTLLHAEEMVSNLPNDVTHTIVLGREGWHPGVIGIVASRLVDRFNRPTVMIALDGQSGKGSARSIKGFHLYRGLQECKEYLDAFGGHEMAAGMTLGSESINAFSQAFEDHARKVLSDEDLLPKLSHDGTALLEELDIETLRQLENLAPFGMGNPEPTLIIERVQNMRMQELKGGHLKFTVCQGAYSHGAIAFGFSERQEEFQGLVDLLVSPQINRYNGREMVQLRVRDVRPTVF